VFLDPANEVGERRDPAAFRGGAPAFEVGARVGGIGGAVEIAQLFFKFPGAPEAVTVSAEQAEDLAVLVVEVLPAGADGESGAVPFAAFGHAGPGGHGGCFGPVDRFDDFVGPLDHMEGVEADPGLWDLFTSDG
jgi:hypothetical protein